MKKYISKPVEAIQLAADMSNWRECCDRIDAENYDDDDVPEFLDIPCRDGWSEAVATDWIVKMITKNGYEWTVFPDDDFKAIFVEFGG